MSYTYVKKRVVLHPASSNLDSKRKIKKLAATALFGVGSLLLFSVLGPLLSFQISANDLRQVVSPVGSKYYSPGEILGDINTDYTQLSNWFATTPSNNPDTNTPALEKTSAASYTISIPKLKIDSAQVILGSQDLKKSLVQYPQTALPGQLGSTVVFGHSVLPQFFNPKSYMTIFSTLFKLKTGDEIFVDYDGVKYRYLVDDMYIIEPTDLSVLEQRYDSRTLTLITCHPPGTYLKRLVIKAKIVD